MQKAPDQSTAAKDTAILPYPLPCASYGNKGFSQAGKNVELAA
jgi:hypothetical protein